MMLYDITTIILVGIVIYIILLFISFSYSCGGYSFKECGFCWVGIIQKPLDIIDKISEKCKK